MTIKVKLIDRNGFEKIQEVKAIQVKYENIFGETETKLDPAVDRIHVPILAQVIGIGAMLVTDGPPITQKTFYRTHKKDNDLCIFEEV